MDLIKKNILSVVSGVLAILSMIVIVFPFSGMYDTLLANVKASWATNAKIQSLLTQQRTWPSLSSKEEDKLPLEHFPTPLTISKGEAMTKDWRNKAEAFRQLAIDLQTKSLKPLVPGALPNGGGPAIGRHFIDAYQRKFGIYVNPTTGVRDESQSLFSQILLSKVPPTDTDVKAEQERVAAELRASRTIWREGKVQNQPEVDLLVAQSQATVADKMRHDRAVQGLIYADPVTVFEINSKIATNQNPSPNDMFQAQVSLWVQEELCRAIRETNEKFKADNKGILNSPIKRLISIKVLPKFVPVPAGTPGTTEPPTVPDHTTTKVTPAFTTNPLGHVSNDFYDVIRFDMVVVVEGAALPEVLTGLARNRYISFRKVNIQSVDSSVDMASGYLYGPAPVIHLTLEGQYLLLRPFLKDLMPTDIVRGLTIQGAPAPGSEGGPGYGGPGYGGPNYGMPGFGGPPGM